MGDLPYDHFLGEFLRRPVGEPAGVGAAGGAPRDYNLDGGYPYGYYAARPVVPAMYYHPGLRDANVEVLVDINDNRYRHAHGGWPNPTVPHPYPQPRPRPEPPTPPPCPGHDCSAAAYHCQGTCGNCGHVGCGASLPYICAYHHVHGLHHQTQHQHQQARGCPHQGCAHHACACRDANHHTCGGGDRANRRQRPVVVEINNCCCRCAPRPDLRDRERDRYRDWDRGERTRGEYAGARFRPESPQGPHRRYGAGPWQDGGRWRWVSD